MKLSTKSKFRNLRLTMHLAGIALLAGIVGGYYSMIFQQIQAQAEEDILRIETLEELVSKSGAVQIKHTELEEEMAELETLATKVRNRLVEPLDKHQLSTAIRDAARRHGVAISQLNVEKTTGYRDHQRTDVRLQCDGSFDSICAFVDQINRLQWIADVTKLRVEASTTSSKRRLNAQLTLFSNHLDNESDNTSS